MKNKIMKSISVALILSLMCLTGCGASTSDTIADSTLVNGGVLYLSVNPEVAITYDDLGIVTNVEACNEDAVAILESYSTYVGKECRQVITELVTAIGEAGYFVENIDGKKRQITIEVEDGSLLPADTFLDDIVSDVRTCVDSNEWKCPIEVEDDGNYYTNDSIDSNLTVSGNDIVTDENTDDDDNDTEVDEPTDNEDVPVGDKPIHDKDFPKGDKPADDKEFPKDDINSEDKPAKDDVLPEDKPAKDDVLPEDKKPGKDDIPKEHEPVEDGRFPNDNKPFHEDKMPENNRPFSDEQNHPDCNAITNSDVV